MLRADDARGASGAGSPAAAKDAGVNTNVNGGGAPVTRLGAARGVS